MHDVCFLLEGSYPFVAGGVSTWVHNLILALPELRFTAVCLVPKTKGLGAPKYDLPDNFDYMVLPLFDDDPLYKRSGKIKPRDIEDIRTLHHQARKGEYSRLQQAFSLFRANNVPLYDIIHGRRSWALFRELQEQYGGDDSFLDYFWTFRFTHLPIFQVLQSRIPPAKVYHSISTGYAGLLGCLARLTTGRPMLLTEHGIYTRERKIEIAQAKWIPENRRSSLRVHRTLSQFQELWVRVFETIGRMTYDHADHILTLYSGNRDLQIREGADPSKIEIVPNGIKLEAFTGLKPADYPSPDQSSFTIGFVGRVVPIKDVKTFLRAIKTAAHSIPEIKALIMGPTDEDLKYYEECLALVKQLELEQQVTFTGKVNVLDHYPNLDLIVLTSISEAQPLVVLEGNCAGIPCVCSDVGSCRELLEGRTDQDRNLGPSGIVTPVADPLATSKAIVRILSDYRLRRQMSQAGRLRVKAFYRESRLNERYRTLYQKAIRQKDGEETPWQE